jgi:alpha-galactosidase
MGTAIKIAVIGAGSATFSLGLVKDLCLTESLRGSHVSFMDVDAERLEMIHRLAVRYSTELGANLTFDSTLDRRAAMQDADFVINTASVVDYRSGLQTRELIKQYGYDWDGPSAGEYAYNNISFMLDVAREIEEICPNAWLIQSGNPVYEGCTAILRETSIKTCGLCHGHYGYRDICDMIGLDWRKVTWQAPGLNHNIWLTHFFYEGKDAYPLIDEWIRAKGEAYWNDTTAVRPVPDGSRRSGELERAWEIDLSRAAVHMYRLYGLMPIGDTVWMKYVGWWYHKDFAAKRYWFGEPWGGQRSHLSWPMYVKNQEKKVRAIAQLAQDPKASLVAALGQTKTHEQQVPIIDGLVNDVQGEFQVNVPNFGALPGVADDVVVEVPAIVNKKGIQPIRVPPLPPKIMLTQILPHVLSMERTLLALKTRDRSLLLWNLLEAQETHAYAQAEAVLEGILQQPYNRAMDEYYQWPQGWEWNGTAQTPVQDDAATPSPAAVPAD